MRKILMIAFHFPPAFGSSGLHRTVKFSQYLPNHGWQPTVLTAHPRAHEQTLPCAERDALVEYAFALDAARHLSIKGRYPGWAAVPDRWISWFPAAVIKGRRLIREMRPDVIWSTYPIATAHLIGLALHRWSGIPWVADLRDPMSEIDPATGIEYPLDPAVRKANRWIERRVISNCARAVLTTPGTAAIYAKRYPDIPAKRWAIIGNGFDEDDFRDAERTADTAHAAQGKRTVLVHSGTLYTDNRDPRAFFEALGGLQRAGHLSAESLRIVLRASGSEDFYAGLLRERGIEDIVLLEPAIPYREALVEMLQADGLLIFQASNCNYQIPAKLYECLRARRPILALTDPAGDTAALLRAEHIDTILPLDDAAAIRAGLLDFLARLRAGTAPCGNEASVSKHAREARTAELAELLDDVLLQPTA